MAATDKNSCRWRKLCWIFQVSELKDFVLLPSLFYNTPFLPTTYGIACYKCQEGGGEGGAGPFIAGEFLVENMQFFAVKKRKIASSVAFHNPYEYSVEILRYLR